MKTAMYIVAILMFAMVCSCGPSEQDKAAIQQQNIAAQQRRDDSVASSVKQKMQMKEQLQSRIANIKNTLTNTNADLAVANDEMHHIQEFQIGRSQSERESQIKNQTIKIQNLNDRIAQLGNMLNENENKLASYQ